MILRIKLRERNINEQDIAQLLKKLGKVTSSMLIMGCVYIVMPNTKEAYQAIRILRENGFEGRKLRTNLTESPLLSFLLKSQLPSVSIMLN